MAGIGTVTGAQTQQTQISNSTIANSCVKSIFDMNSFNRIKEEAGGKLIVIDFHAVWCGPCKMIAPAVEDLAKEFENEVLIVKCDVDENAEVSQMFEIVSMPTFVLLKNGTEVARKSGANKEMLKALIIQYK